MRSPQAVDGQSTSATALDVVDARLRGRPDSAIVLSIARAGVAEAFTVEVVREF
jgi:C-terminal processing protease CtpA/Prc